MPLLLPVVCWQSWVLELIEASLRSLTSFPYDVLPLHVTISKFLLFVKTLVILV